MRTEIPAFEGVPGDRRFSLQFQAEKKTKKKKKEKEKREREKREIRKKREEKWSKGC